MVAKRNSKAQDILQALALMLESSRGARITTAALAAELGCSEAALYRHFPSKTKMYEGLIDFIEETIAVLEHITELESLKDEELDVIGELISNLYGALEVQKSMEDGLSKKDALNGFMQRVLGSIDK